MIRGWYIVYCLLYRILVIVYIEGFERRREIVGDKGIENLMDFSFICFYDFCLYFCDYIYK